MKSVLVALFFVIPFVAQAQDIPSPVQSETPADVPPTAIGMPLSATETVLVKDTTITVEIPKEEYEALKSAAVENQRLQARRNQLIRENERLAMEVGLWRGRLERILQCSTIPEAIDELRSVLAGPGEK